MHFPARRLMSNAMSAHGKREREREDPWNSLIATSRIADVLGQTVRKAVNSQGRPLDPRQAGTLERVGPELHSAWDRRNHRFRVVEPSG